MYWSLQGDAIEKDDLTELKSFIDKTDRFTQSEKVREFEEKYSVALSERSYLTNIILSEIIVWSGFPERLLIALTIIFT